jgi:hypothetical protein
MYASEPVKIYTGLPEGTNKIYALVTNLRIKEICRIIWDHKNKAFYEKFRETPFTKKTSNLSECL